MTDNPMKPGPHDQAEPDVYREAFTPPEVPAAPATGRTLPMIWAADIVPVLSGAWAVKGLIPQRGLFVLYGHSGTGKSFLLVDMLLHIACGMEWAGRKVEPGLIVYVAAEGSQGVLNRVAAWKQHHGIADPPFVVVPTAIDLFDPDADLPALMETIRLAVKQSGKPLAGIAVDTVSKTMGSGKENTDDMAIYIANNQRVSDAFGCVVGLVHHRPKDAESKDPRGHSSLRAGVDTVLLVEGEKGDRTIECRKQKDGEQAAPMGFRLVQVDLGTDPDGEPVRSCIVEMLETAPRPVSATGKRLTAGQAIALRTLRELVDEAGEYPPEGIPAAMLKPGVPVRGVSVATWQARVMAITADAADKKPDSLRRTFQRNVDALQHHEMIGVWDGFAWVR